ncbi:hypothetical protein N7488_011179 [Penicillium malachiteum]|nr:hypothetical protein N7488_011179 [Penicillium malachiteum]
MRLIRTETPIQLGEFGHNDLATLEYAILSHRWQDELASSVWFTRGWTLQELIAPREMVFLDHMWQEIGQRKDLCNEIEKITKIDKSLLLGQLGLNQFSIAKRMSWASARETTRMEDQAYCLLGIFDVNMPLLYGEGAKAFIRLQEEIMRDSEDESLFAWETQGDGTNHAIYTACGSWPLRLKTLRTRVISFLFHYLRMRDHLLQPTVGLESSHLSLMSGAITGF